MTQDLYKKFSFILPWEVYEEIQRTALQDKISISDVVRKRLLYGRETSANIDSKNQILSLLQSVHQKLTDQEVFSLTKDNPSSNQNYDPLLLEILFLFREFLFERNGQILRRVDEKLDRHFGKDRKKIL